MWIDSRHCRADPFECGGAAARQEQPAPCRCEDDRIDPLEAREIAIAYHADDGEPLADAALAIGIVRSTAQRVLAAEVRPRERLVHDRLARGVLGEHPSAQDRDAEHLEEPGRDTSEEDRLEIDP